LFTKNSALYKNLQNLWQISLWRTFALLARKLKLKMGKFIPKKNKRFKVFAKATRQVFQDLELVSDGIEGRKLQAHIKGDPEAQFEFDIGQFIFRPKENKKQNSSKS